MAGHWLVSESASVYHPKAVHLTQIALQPQNLQHESVLRITFENITSNELSFLPGIFGAAKWESMVRGNRMYMCEGGWMLWGWEKAEPSRPDGRLLALRLNEELPLCKHEEFTNYYMDGNWMQIWGLAFQRWHVRPQDGSMRSSHDSGKEGERKEILLCRNLKSLGENIFQVSEKTNIWSFQWVRKKMK